MGQHVLGGGAVGDLKQATAVPRPARMLAVAVVLVVGLVVGAAPAVASGSLNWSAPTLTDDNAQPQLADVACPTASQCTALTGQGGVITFDPTNPGVPGIDELDATAPYDGGGWAAIACPSSSQCTAVVGGDEVTFDPSAPEGATEAQVDMLINGYQPQMQAVACPSTSQCTAVDNSGQEVTFDPRSPTTPPQIVFGFGGRLIDCPSTQQCTLADGAGDEITFDPQSPGTANVVSVSNEIGFRAISCPSLHQCTGAGDEGWDSTFDPTSPANPNIGVVEDGVSDVTGLACPTLAECVGVDDDVTGGQVIRFDPNDPRDAVQTRVVPVNDVLQHVVCPSASECVAVGNKGLELTFDPADPGQATPTDIAGRNALLSIACPSATQCAAGDGIGQQVDFAPASPGAATVVPMLPYLTPVLAISCPLVTQCVGAGTWPVGDEPELAEAFDPQTAALLGGQTLFEWGSDAPSPPPTLLIPALACPSANQCTALDILGIERSYDPLSGVLLSIGIADDASSLGVACPSAVQCTAVDAAGQEVTFDPISTESVTPIAIDPGHGLTAIACPWSTQCTAVDDAGREITFDPAAPTQAATADIDGSSLLQDLACPSLAACTAVDDAGNAIAFDPANPGASTVTPVDSTSPLNAIACPSASLCIAVDGEGDVAVGTGATAVPTLSSQPAIVGTAKEGDSLTASSGTWTGNPTSFRYQWDRCDPTGSNCRTISGVTGPSYTLTAADAGATIDVVATAVSAGGPSAPASTPVTAVIQAAPSLATPSAGSGAAGASAAVALPTATSPAAGAPRMRSTLAINGERLRARGHTATFTLRPPSADVQLQCALVRRRHGTHPSPQYTRCITAKTYRGLHQGARYIFYVRVIDQPPITRQFTAR